MSTSYRLRAAYLYFAHPTPILPDQWSRNVLGSLYPELDLDAVRIVGRTVGNLPTQAQVDAGMEEAGYGKPAYEWNRRTITDSTGKPVILVEVYEAPVPVAAPADMTDTRTPPRLSGSPTKKLPIGTIARWRTVRGPTGSGRAGRRWVHPPPPDPRPRRR